MALVVVQTLDGVGVQADAPTPFSVTGLPGFDRWEAPRAELAAWPTRTMLHISGTPSAVQPTKPWWRFELDLAVPDLVYIELGSIMASHPDLPLVRATITVIGGMPFGGIYKPTPLTSHELSSALPMLERLWGLPGVRRGRPAGSGQWRSRAELEVALRGVLDGYAHGNKRPSAVEIAATIGVTPRHLRREVARWFGCKLDELIESFQ